MAAVKHNNNIILPLKINSSRPTCLQSAAGPSNNTWSYCIQAFSPTHGYTHGSRQTIIKTNRILRLVDVGMYGRAAGALARRWLSAYRLRYRYRYIASAAGDNGMPCWKLKAAVAAAAAANARRNRWRLHSALIRFMSTRPGFVSLTRGRRPRHLSADI